MSFSKVSVVKCSGEERRTAMARLIQLLGLPETAKRIAIKLNLCDYRKWETGATSDPKVLGALLEALRPLPKERLENEVHDVTYRHVAEEAAQQTKGLNRVMRQLIQKQSSQAGTTLRVDHLTGEAGGIDLRTFEVLVPVDPLIHQSPLHVFLPERCAAVDAQPVKPEGVQTERGRKPEGGAHILDGLVRIPDDKKPVHDIDPCLLGVHDRGLDLRQSLLLF